MGGNAMVNLKTGKSDRVKGKDVYGKMMTLVRTQPKQLSLFQTFLPETDDKYSNTIDLYDAVPKYFPTKHMAQYFGHFLSERGEQMRPQTGSMW
jgi:hypothetical protein